MVRDRYGGTQISSKRPFPSTSSTPGWGSGSGPCSRSIAFEYGVRHFESALGGLGGCPYAPGAAGNLDTERLVQFFMAQGENLCVDLDRLQSVRQRLFTVLSQHLSTPSAEIR